MFQIADRAFEVNSAVLFAEIRNLEEAQNMWGKSNRGICWFLEVTTVDNASEENDFWEPSAECICHFPNDVLWQEIEGQQLQWEESWDETTGNQRSTLYLLSHYPMNRSKIEFSNRSGDTFSMKWSAYCDLGWSEKYGDDVSIVIESTVQFLGIAVYEKDTAKAWEMLEQFQPIKNFQEGSLGTYSGNAVTEFQPIEAK